MTTAPDPVGGTDAAATFTEAESARTGFAAIHPCPAECMGIHGMKEASWCQALKPIRLPSRNSAGQWRHDPGSVYLSDDFPVPGFRAPPEGNGCIERFFSTLQEQLVWHRRFRDLGALRTTLVEVRERNTTAFLHPRMKPPLEIHDR